MGRSRSYGARANYARDKAAVAEASGGPIPEYYGTPPRSDKPSLMITVFLHLLRLFPFLCGGHRQLAFVEAFPDDTAPSHLLHDRDTDLRPRLSATRNGLGDPRSAHGRSQPMAESLRGAAHRLDPARVPRPSPRSQRTPPAPHPDPLLRVLSPGTHSPLARQGRTRQTANRAAAVRCDYPDSRSRWSASSLRPTRRSPTLGSLPRRRPTPPALVFLLARYP
jgi:hypothetical protein